MSGRAEIKKGYKKTISIGVPCYNEEENVTEAYRELKRVTNKKSKYTYEFIFVDNGSTDGTKKLIRKIASKDKNVVGVFLTRNFGPEASGQAALDKATGDAFIFYECDLQDPPDLILDFIKKWEAGFEIVVGTRDKLQDNVFMTIMRRVFYKVFKAISNIDVPVNAGSFGIMDRKVLDALAQFPEKYRFLRGLRSWVGFKTAYIPYRRRERRRGESSYNFFDYIKHAERGVFGFSYLPLDLMVYSGFIVVALSFLFIVGYLYTVIVFGNPIRASIPLMLAIVFFGGVTLLAISILGKYIQVVVEETKARPLYIIEEIVNAKKKSARRPT